MKLLVVVDMQNDFITGSLRTPEAVKIVDRVAEIMENFPGKVICTRDTHGENYLETSEGKKLPVKHCIRGTEGHELCPKVSAAAEACGAQLLDKTTFGSRDLPRLVEELAGGALESIELVGLCTDICVISNALLLKAFFPETPIRVDASACAGVTPESHENALKAMAMCQIDLI